MGVRKETMGARKRTMGARKKTMGAGLCQYGTCVVNVYDIVHTG